MEGGPCRERGREGARPTARRGRDAPSPDAPAASSGSRHDPARRGAGVRPPGRRATRYFETGASPPGPGRVGEGTGSVFFCAAGMVSCAGPTACACGGCSCELCSPCGMFWLAEGWLVAWPGALPWPAAPLAGVICGRVTPVAGAAPPLGAVSGLAPGRRRGGSAGGGPARRGGRGRGSRRLGRRQRLGAGRQRAQVGDDVGALLVVLDAGEAHLGAGGVLARRVQPLVELGVGPGARVLLQRGGVVEPRMARHLAA